MLYMVRDRANVQALLEQIFRAGVLLPFCIFTEYSSQTSPYITMKSSLIYNMARVVITKKSLGGIFTYRDYDRLLAMGMPVAQTDT